MVRVGSAHVEITPPLGTQISGAIGIYRPAEWVMDPLYAKALVVESDDCRLCLVAADLGVMTTPVSDRIRRDAAQAFGLDPGAVMLHATHSHSAPGAGRWGIDRDHCPEAPPYLDWLYGDERYDQIVHDRILEAIGRAIEALRPAQIATARGIESRVAFNRRFVMRDGRVVTHPRLADPNICYAEGPMDPEVGIMCAVDEALTMRAVLLSHSCHPVHGYPLRYVSADWPGVWANTLREQLGGDTALPLVLTGTAGNIHHNDHLNPNYRGDQDRMGRILTETTLRAMRELKVRRDAPVSWRVERFSLPTRRLDPKDVEKAAEFIRSHPEPVWLDAAKTSIDWDWYYALSTLELSRIDTGSVEYEIQAFRIGDVAILGLMGEPFVEAGLALKTSSPAVQTFVTGMCNGALGYIPTPEAFARGGYETRTSTWSRLAPEAFNIVVEQARRLLHRMFEET